MDPIAVNPITEPTFNPIPVVDNTTAPTLELPPDVLDSRANKAAFGLNKPQEEVKQGIQTGEATFRESVSAEIDNKKQSDLQNVLMNVAYRKQGPLTTNEQNYVAQALKANEQFTNPQSVFEYEYAKKYMDMLPQVAQQKPGSWYDDVLATFPEHVSAASRLGAKYVAKQEIISTELQNAEVELANQGMGGYLADRLKGILTLGVYGDIKERARVQGSGYFSGLGLGTNLQSQREQLYKIDNLDEFTATFKKIMESLKKDNPGIAVDFARSMMGMSASGIVSENLGSVLTYTGIPGTGKLLGIASQRLGLLKKATETMVENNANYIDRVSFNRSNLPDVSAADLGRLESQNIDALKGVPTYSNYASFSRDGLPDVNFNDISKLTASEVAALGTGDLKEAAAIRVTNHVLDSFNGTANPAQHIMDGLVDAFDTQARELVANPGPKAVDGINRLTEQLSKTSNNILTGIQNMMRINRTPVVSEAAEATVKALQAASRDDYRWPSLSFLDTKGPYKVLNNLWFEHQLGPVEGGMFTNREGAVTAAITNGIGLKGEKDAARQLELQRLIKITEGQLGYARDVPSVLNGQTILDKTLQKLEGDLGKYNNELDTLRKSPGATIEQQGLHFYISSYVPGRETDKVMRSLLLTTDTAKTPEGLLTHALGFLRTPDETLSPSASINAKIAAVGPNNLLKSIQEELKPIAKLARWTIPGTSKKERWLDWERVVRGSQQRGDPVTGEKGYMFKGEGELYAAYQSEVGRTPIQAEVDAYFALKRYNELYNGLVDLRATTDKLRLGVEQHTISLVDENGKKVVSPAFEAIRQGEKPRSDETIYRSTGRVGEGQLIRLAKLTADKDALTAIEEGKLRVLRIADPDAKPLLGFDGIGTSDRVRYVIAPSIESRPMPFNRIAKRNSGLFEQDFDHYVTQAVVSHDRTTNTNWYSKDMHWAGFMNNKMANDVNDILNNVRLLLKNKEYDAAKEAAKTLPKDWSDIEGMFVRSRNADGTTTPARYNINLPFQVVPKNKMTIEMNNEVKDFYGKSFVDGTLKGSDVRELRYLSAGKQRDPYEVFGVSDIGSRANPEYVAGETKYLDPIPALNRSMNRMVNSTFMDDYKLFSIEHWIQEAKQYIKADKIEDIEGNPFHYFHNGKLLENIPKDISSRLEGNREKIKAILGQPSATDSWLHYLAQKSSDAIYEKGGPAASKLDPSWVLPGLSDAGRFMRSVTYHTTIGLFALPQVLVQSMNWVTMLGIEGFERTGQGFVGSLLHQYSRINGNPEILAGLDRVASKMGYKPGEWLEARNALMQTGFHIVGNEHALLDNPFSAKVISNAGKDFLDLGSIFFRETDRHSRFGAWYMAYKRFREENPIGKLGENDLGEIFNRADMLSGNMTSASKSMIQRGVFSFPTQFMAYNLRLAELMTGHRLSYVEKARLFTTYAGAFGVSAAGIAGFPFGDMIRKSAIDQGYVPGDDFVTTLEMEGLPAYLLHGITNNWYNVGQRYGSPGFDQIRDVLAGDKPWYQLIGGASYSTLANVANGTDGLRSWVASLYQDDDKYYKPTVNDFVAPLQALTSFSSGVRVLAAVNTGNWLSRKGVILDKEVTPANAAFMGASGLQPLNVGDLKALTALDKDKKALEAQVEQKFYTNYNRAVQAFNNNDPDLGMQELANARVQLILGNYPQEKIASLLSRAAQGKESRVATAFRNFYLKNQTPDQKALHAETYGKWQELNKKGQ